MNYEKTRVRQEATYEIKYQFRMRCTLQLIAIKAQNEPNPINFPEIRNEFMDFNLSIFADRSVTDDK